MLFIIVGLFTALTIAVINPSGWVFNSTGGMTLLLVAKYVGKIPRSLKIKNNSMGRRW